MYFVMLTPHLTIHLGVNFRRKWENVSKFCLRGLTLPEVRRILGHYSEAGLYRCGVCGRSVVTKDATITFLCCVFAR